MPRATSSAARRCYDVMELSAKFFADTLAVAQRRQGPRLSRRPHDLARGAVAVSHRLRARRRTRFALKEHLGSLGIPVEDMVEAGLLMAGDDIPGAVRSFSRPRDVSDIGCPRPGDRVRRPRAGKGRRRQSISIRRKPRCFTRATISTIWRPRGSPPITAARWWWSKAMSTSSPWSATGLPASVAPLGTAHDRKPARAVMEDGRRADPLF